MCNDILFGSRCRHKVWLCFVVFIVHVECICIVLGTVYMYGGYYVHYSKTIQNNKKSKRIQTRFCKSCFL